jgi:hypothetical protein
MWMLSAGDVAGAEGLHAGHVHDGGERAAGAAWPSHTTRLAGARSHAYLDNGHHAEATCGGDQSVG